VVIPTFDRPEYLREALECIVKGELQSFEVLVMDQSDDGRTEDAVRALADGRIHHHRMPRRGACPARNLGAALAQGEIVAFLDDDCSPAPDWLLRAVAAFDADAELQFIFGQLKAPDHDRTLGWFPEFIPDGTVEMHRASRKIITYAAGANMVGRKTFIRRLGGFDELLGPAVPWVKSNDSSMAYKVFRSGEKWAASADVSVIHTNGFRPYDELGALFRGYSHGLGVNYGRFVRRGDWRAVWYFVLDNAGLLGGTVVSVVRLRGPRGARMWVGHLRGFFDGLRLPGAVGYIDGAEIRRMEATGELDRS
jgi:glycosyltransferase involved in cell wall biosynthesis